MPVSITSSVASYHMHSYLQLVAINSIDATLLQHMAETIRKIKETVTHRGRAENILEGVSAIERHLHV